MKWQWMVGLVLGLTLVGGQGMAQGPKGSTKKTSTPAAPVAPPAPAPVAPPAPAPVVNMANNPLADEVLTGLWYDVAVECPFCLTFDRQNLVLGQAVAMLKYSDRLELTPASRSGKTITRTQGTETVTRSLKLFLQPRKKQVILIQYVEGDGDRAADMFARIWVVTPMAGGKMLYGRRYQISAFTEEAFEPRAKGYRAREKYLPPERLLTILEDVRVYSLNDARKIYQAGDQARVTLDGAVAFVRENFGESEVALAKEEAMAQAQERTSRENLFRTLVQQGDQAYASERYDDALNQYKAASAILPEMSLVHADLGAVYLIQTRLPEAEAAFRLALELDPSDVDSIFNLAMVLEQGGRLNEAVEQYKEVMTRRPQDTEARDRLNRLSARLKR